jgi:alpha-glucosidase
VRSTKFLHALLATAILAILTAGVGCSDSATVTPPGSDSVAIEWWRRGIVYQIYPRSFQDTDGNGVGDLTGIAERLDYLKWLGVDAIWISPIYPSPMADFGYDVSDYTDIHSVFGQLADFDKLLAAAHARGLRVILDFVPNHTSDQHPWFIESRRSLASPKRDWYLWRDPEPSGGPPNNWVAVFGGPAWELDLRTGQYYYHAFLKEQPDLNWRNPVVQQAMFDVLKFWLDRGVDGFRVDVIWLLLEDEQFRDNPVNPDFRDGMLPALALRWVHTEDQPENHELVRRMRRVLDEYSSRVLIGEIFGPVDRLAAYYGATCDEAHLPFNFQLIEAPWDAGRLADLIQRYEESLPACGWPNWVVGNHDQHRVASRLGQAQARLAAMLLLTLRGTPTLYYGDELGIPDAVVPPDRVQDPLEKQQPGRGLGRDPERSPMPWNDSENAGFTRGQPWLPLVADWRTLNVEVQRNNPGSMLSLYRRLIALRREAPAFEVGEYVGLPVQGSVLAYVRRLAGYPSYVVALNLGPAPAQFSTDRVDVDGHIVISTNSTLDGERVRGVVRLSGNEGVVIQLTD